MEATSGVAVRSLEAGVMPSDNPHLVPQLLAGAVVFTILILAATVELGGGARAANARGSMAVAPQTTATQARGLRATASVVAGAASSGVAHVAEQLMGGRHDTALREDWKPFFENLESAVARADGAADVEVQASAIADLAMTCGQCHRASRARIPSSSPTALPSDAVQVHAWAAEQLWVGLSEPNEQAWHRGIDALAADPVLGASLLPVSTPIAAASERARYFGRVLSACGGCHAQAHRAADGVFAHIGQ